jgi:protein O-mannosyl-transferase
MRPTQDNAGAPVASKGRGRRWAVALLLLGLVLVAYRPVWQAGFIWDDDGHVTRPDLRPPSGLLRIWFEPGATQQYYPLLHSAFWIEHRLWGDAALGYHLANVVLHGTAAFLLFVLLRRLGVPGALLAATVFAVHPVAVESVAWISEQKNTLSAVLYLAAALAYLRFDAGRRAAWYGIALGLFAMAVATKSVTASLPAALLVVFWWKRGRLSWRTDVLPLLPWLCAAGAAGAVTAWVERTFIGASGAPFQMSWADRFLVAGRALWFYLGKVVWPARLMFIYPRWRVDPHAAWQYLFPGAALLAFGVAFALRGRARGPLASALLYTGTLFPALGFVNVYPFIYSFVADHFQYLAAAMALSAMAAVLALGAARLSRAGQIAARAAGAGLVACLLWRTERQCAPYADAETLWRATLALNPECWMAQENLGGVLMKEGRGEEAQQHFQAALGINPRDVDALNDLGVALLHDGQVDPAIGEFGRALALAPNYAETHINLGAAYLQKREGAEAAAEFQRAVALQPGSALSRRDLAAAYLLEGRAEDAIAELRRAERIDPADARIPFDLGNAFMGTGRYAEAVACYTRALEDEPKAPEVDNNLGNALLKTGAPARAVAAFRRALELRGDTVEAHFNLSRALLQDGRLDEAILHLQRAVALQPDFADGEDTLAEALLQRGRFDEAVLHFQRAADLDPGNAQIHNDLGTALVKEGKPDEALPHFQRASELKPDLTAAWTNLGNYWLKHRRPAEAAEDYGKALVLEPNEARIRNSLGISLIMQGRPDEAAAQFRWALRINPGYAEAQKNLERLLEQTSR